MLCMRGYSECDSITDGVFPSLMRPLSSTWWHAQISVSPPMEDRTPVHIITDIPRQEVFLATASPHLTRICLILQCSVNQTRSVYGSPGITNMWPGVSDQLRKLSINFFLLFTCMCQLPGDNYYLFTDKQRCKHTNMHIDIHSWIIITCYVHN